MTELREEIEAIRNSKDNAYLLFIKTKYSPDPHSRKLFFGRAQRVRRLASELADKLEQPNKWRIEVAAIFSQIASITLPESVSEDVYHKRDLTQEVKKIVSRFPEVTEQMLEKIPRLDEVREIISKIDVQPRFEAPDEVGTRKACETLKVFGVMMDGGLCERSLIRADKLHPSEKLSYEQLALVETLAIGCHATDREHGGLQGCGDRDREINPDNGHRLLEGTFREGA